MANVNIYTLLREKIGGGRGDRLNKKILKEHQDNRELLYSVGKCTSPELDVNLKKAMESVFYHIEEEDKVLPLLREHVQKMSSDILVHVSRPTYLCLRQDLNQVFQPKVILLLWQCRIITN